jgi:pyruvate dehydrogenase E2 component (dihydrolipoamide acetyltransferase)
MGDVVMPRLSDSMEEGTIIRWLKADGDEVARGDELVEIETDKANMTYEADEAGTLKIVAGEGDTLPIGEVIARLGEGGSEPESEAKDEAEAEPDSEPKDEGQEEDGAEPGQEPEPDPEPEAEPARKEAPATVAEQPESAPPASANGDGERVKASPVARRMAKEMGVDLGALEGTGPGGRIVKADVESGPQDGGGSQEKAAPPAAGEEPAAGKGAAAPTDSGSAKGEVTQQELSRTQQLIARRMAEAKATVPEFTLTTEIDMAAAVDVRAQLKALAGDGPVPSFNDMIVKACARALRDFPRANGAYRDGRFELYSRVNVGVAVAADDALVVPTVFDADRKSLGEIAAQTRSLAEKVRAKAITPPELSGGTFTVSNLGMFGVTEFVAVINPPQAAILAVGALRDAPVVREGAVVPGKLMNVTLACDHRILYGADAAKFLARVRELLEQPLALAL